MTGVERVEGRGGRLSLRARLVVGVALVVVLQAVAGMVVIAYVSDQLLDQIDERLDAAVDATAGIDDLYQASLDEDGMWRTVSPARIRGEVADPPDLATALDGGFPTDAFTVDATGGDLEYRVLVLDDGDAVRLLASPLRGYDWTVTRLSRLVLLVAAAMIAVTIAVAWWVIRLGIRPLRAMTTKADAIAAGNLAERIEHVDRSTEAGQLGSALNEMMSQIEASFAQRDESERRLRDFIADAAHELRTPVATIRGYAELHQGGGLREDDALDDAMRRTAHESQRMTRLINDMLSLARLDLEPTLSWGEVDLRLLLRDVADAARARHVDLRLEVVTPDEPVVVTADADLLHQALANLVSNAATHAGPDATTVAAVAIEGDEIVLSVRDDGIGMREEDARRASERFFRADASRSRSSGGAGLGLAIVDEIATAHGGRLDFTSQPGGGSCAQISIPRHR